MENLVPVPLTAAPDDPEAIYMSAINGLSLREAIDMITDGKGDPGNKIWNETLTKVYHAMHDLRDDVVNIDPADLQMAAPFLHLLLLKKQVTEGHITDKTQIAKIAHLQTFVAGSYEKLQAGLEAGMERLSRQAEAQNKLFGFTSTNASNTVNTRKNMRTNGGRLTRGGASRPGAAAKPAAAAAGKPAATPIGLPMPETRSNWGIVIGAPPVEIPFTGGLDSSATMRIQYDESLQFLISNWKKISNNYVISPKQGAEADLGELFLLKQLYPIEAKTSETYNNVKRRASIKEIGDKIDLMFKSLYWYLGEAYRNHLLKAIQIKNINDEDILLTNGVNSHITVFLKTLIDTYTSIKNSDEVSSIYATYKNVDAVTAFEAIRTQAAQIRDPNTELGRTAEGIPKAELELLIATLKAVSIHLANGQTIESLYTNYPANTVKKGNEDTRTNSYQKTVKSLDLFVATLENINAKMTTRTEDASQKKARALEILKIEASTGVAVGALKESRSAMITAHSISDGEVEAKHAEGMVLYKNNTRAGLKALIDEIKDKRKNWPDKEKPFYRSPAWWAISDGLKSKFNNVGQAEAVIQECVGKITVWSEDRTGIILRASSNERMRVEAEQSRLAAVAAAATTAVQEAEEAQRAAAAASDKLRALTPTNANYNTIVAEGRVQESKVTAALENVPRLQAEMERAGASVKQAEETLKNTAIIGEIAQALFVSQAFYLAFKTDSPKSEYDTYIGKCQTFVTNLNDLIRDAVLAKLTSLTEMTGCEEMVAQIEKLWVNQEVIATKLALASRNNNAAGPVADIGDTDENTVLKTKISEAAEQIRLFDSLERVSRVEAEATKTQEMSRRAVLALTTYLLDTFNLDSKTDTPVSKLYESYVKDFYMGLLIYDGISDAHSSIWHESGGKAAAEGQAISPLSLWHNMYIKPQWPKAIEIYRGFNMGEFRKKWQGIDKINKDATFLSIETSPYKLYNKFMEKSTPPSTAREDMGMTFIDLTKEDVPSLLKPGIQNSFKEREMKTLYVALYIEYTNPNEEMRKINKHLSESINFRKGASEDNTNKVMLKLARQVYKQRINNMVYLADTSKFHNRLSKAWAAMAAAHPLKSLLGDLVVATKPADDSDPYSTDSSNPRKKAIDGVLALNDLKNLRDLYSIVFGDDDKSKKAALAEADLDVADNLAYYLIKVNNLFILNSFLWDTRANFTRGKITYILRNNAGSFLEFGPHVNMSLGAPSANQLSNSLGFALAPWKTLADRKPLIKSAATAIAAIVAVYVISTNVVDWQAEKAAAALKANEALVTTPFERMFTPVVQLGVTGGSLVGAGFLADRFLVPPDLKKEWNEAKEKADTTHAQNKKSINTKHLADLQQAWRSRNYSDPDTWATNPANGVKIPKIGKFAVLDKKVKVAKERMGDYAVIFEDAISTSHCYKKVDGAKSNLIEIVFSPPPYRSTSSVTLNGRIKSWTTETPITYTITLDNTTIDPSSYFYAAFKYKEAAAPLTPLAARKILEDPKDAAEEEAAIKGYGHGPLTAINIPESMLDAVMGASDPLQPELVPVTNLKPAAATPDFMDYLQYYRNMATGGQYAAAFAKQQPSGPADIKTLLDSAETKYNEALATEKTRYDAVITALGSTPTEMTKGEKVRGQLSLVFKALGDVHKLVDILAASATDANVIPGDAVELLERFSDADSYRELQVWVEPIAQELALCLQSIKLAERTWDEFKGDAASALLAWSSIETQKRERLQAAEKRCRGSVQTSLMAYLDSMKNRIQHGALFNVDMHKSHVGFSKLMLDAGIRFSDRPGLAYEVVTDYSSRGGALTHPIHKAKNRPRMRQRGGSLEDHYKRLVEIRQNPFMQALIERLLVEGLSNYYMKQPKVFSSAPFEEQFAAAMHVTRMQFSMGQKLIEQQQVASRSTITVRPGLNSRTTGIAARNLPTVIRSGRTMANVNRVYTPMSQNVPLAVMSGGASRAAKVPSPAAANATVPTANATANATAKVPAATVVALPDPFSREAAAARAAARSATAGPNLTTTAQPPSAFNPGINGLAQGHYTGAVADPSASELIKNLTLASRYEKPETKFAITEALGKQAKEIQARNAAQKKADLDCVVAFGKNIGLATMSLALRKTKIGGLMADYTSKAITADTNGLMSRMGLPEMDKTMSGAMQSWVADSFKPGEAPKPNVKTLIKHTLLDKTTNLGMKGWLADQALAAWESAEGKAEGADADAQKALLLNVSKVSASVKSLGFFFGEKENWRKIWEQYNNKATKAENKLECLKYIRSKFGVPSSENDSSTWFPNETKLVMGKSAQGKFYDEWKAQVETIELTEEERAAKTKCGITFEAKEPIVAIHHKWGQLREQDKRLKIWVASYLIDRYPNNFPDGDRPETWKSVWSHDDIATHYGSSNERYLENLRTKFTAVSADDGELPFGINTNNAAAPRNVAGASGNGSAAASSNGSAARNVAAAASGNRSAAATRNGAAARNVAGASGNGAAAAAAPPPAASGSKPRSRLAALASGVPTGVPAGGAAARARWAALGGRTTRRASAGTRKQNKRKARRSTVRNNKTHRRVGGRRLKMVRRSRR